MTRDKTSVRWTMVGLLTGFSFVSYVERMNISVAAQFMQPEFGIDKVQMGRVFSAFLLGYALFQVPAGRAGTVWPPEGAHDLGHSVGHYDGAHGAVARDAGHRYGSRVSAAHGAAVHPGNR